MRWITFLLLPMLALSGCLSDDAGTDGGNDTIGDDTGDEPRPPMNMEETWYLHDIRAACDNDNPGRQILSPNVDEENSADGCGAFGAGGSAGGFTLSFVAETNSTGFSNGTVDAHVFVGYANPGEYTATIAIKAAGKTVFSGSQTVTSTSTYVVPNYEDFSFSGPLTGEVPYGAKFTMDVTLEGGASYFMGYGSEHPSRFTVA